MSFWCSPTEHPRARKQHNCQLCVQPIEVGVVYDRWCCVIDGDISTVKVHSSCWLLLKEYTEPYDYYEISDDALDEAFRWAEPTREDCIKVAGEDGGRVWDFFRKPEEDDEEADKGGAADHPQP